MGKDGFLTAKAIGIRIKAKGLQKLRWYCQMCQKQCRDENGFKCHINSESHQRQMLLFSENASQVLTDNAMEFKRTFLDTLRTRYGTRKVLANAVYQEYISDRHHMHMNATCWSTLAQFCKYLGRNGDCKVEESERGWYLTYIDRSPEALKRMADAERKDRAHKDAETEEREWLEAQMERARVLAEEREAKARAAAGGQKGAGEATGGDCPDAAGEEGMEEEGKAGLDADAKPDPGTRQEPAHPSDASAPAPLPPPPSSSPPSTGFVKSSQPIKLSLGLKKPAAPTASSTPTTKKRGLAAMMLSMPSSAATISSSTASASPPPLPPRPAERSALERIMEEERERKRRREQRTSKPREPGAGYGFRRVH
ncbi:hypothetical protein GGF31_001550 [Allomyces arbusculus]|nr:hypothetical protein GGF31_001550 [Allomyces arbusculus]